MIFAGKIDGTTQLMWRIWFAGDCASYQAGQLRSYEIVKDNQTIFQMTERKTDDIFQKEGEHLADII